MINFKHFIIVFLVILITLNIFSLSLKNNPYTKAKISMVSLSKGDQYFGRLSLWYLFARSGNWDDATLLEPKLDPADYLAFKSVNNPSDLKKYINNIQIKTNKTTEDWLELARVQSVLGQKEDCLNSITKAKSLDLVRDDLDQIYYQLAK